MVRFLDHCYTFLSMLWTGMTPLSLKWSPIFHLILIHQECSLFLPQLISWDFPAFLQGCLTQVVNFIYLIKDYCSILIMLFIWQSPWITFLGACEGDIEPWNSCWGRALGLLCNICIFCLPIKYIWHCKFLLNSVSIILEFYMLQDCLVKSHLIYCLYISENLSWRNMNCWTILFFWQK